MTAARGIREQQLLALVVGLGRPLWAASPRRDPRGRASARLWVKSSSSRRTTLRSSVRSAARSRGIVRAALRSSCPQSRRSLARVNTVASAKPYVGGHVHFEIAAEWRPWRSNTSAVWTRMPSRIPRTNSPDALRSPQGPSPQRPVAKAARERAVTSSGGPLTALGLQSGLCQSGI